MVVQAVQQVLLARSSRSILGRNLSKYDFASPILVVVVLFRVVLFHVVHLRRFLFLFVQLSSVVFFQSLSPYIVIISQPHNKASTTDRGISNTKL